MKPFFVGKLFSADASPFHQALTHEQCIQYALDRPGVRDTTAEWDYSVVGTLAAERAEGSCVYCNHCQPCPAQIDIGLVNRYYDLARAGDRLAAGHYDKLAVKADACLHCGHCDSRCPFHVRQGDRMSEIAAYFAGLNR